MGSSGDSLAGYQLMDPHGNLVPLSGKQAKRMAKNRGIYLGNAPPYQPSKGERRDGGKGSGKGAKGKGSYKGVSGLQPARETYEPRPRVLCQNLACPGCQRNGQVVPSFKYVDDFVAKRGANYASCMACGQGWDISIMAYTRAFGPLPGTQLVQMGEQGGAQAEPPVVSPFSGANMAPIGTNWTCSMTSPFVVAPSFASLPKDIQDLVDERFKADFVKVLDPSQKEQDKHKILAIMDERQGQPVWILLPGGLG